MVFLLHEFKEGCKQLLLLGGHTTSVSGFSSKVPVVVAVTTIFLVADNRPAFA
uniref:Uncharacterized protein n=1 Tax=Hyaloperonospora arabidopsidis (strain Emoy2) TaxID=559515 RepID=M4BB39_HYAAE